MGWRHSLAALVAQFASGLLQHLLPSLSVFFFFFLFFFFFFFLVRTSSPAVLLDCFGTVIQISLFTEGTLSLLQLAGLGYFSSVAVSFVSDNFFENRLFTNSAKELDSGLPVSPSASRSCSGAFSNSASNPGVDSVLFHQPSVLCLTHTPSSAFRHLPLNSARFSYATEVALFISAQLSSDAVSALRKVPVLI